MSSFQRDEIAALRAEIARLTAALARLTAALARLTAALARVTAQRDLLAKAYHAELWATMSRFHADDTIDKYGLRIENGIVKEVGDCSRTTKTNS